MKNIFLINLVLLFHLPVKNNNNETKLFVIERSRDSDIIYYYLNASDGGKLDTNKPISYYWIKESKGYIKEPLTRIQEDMGYGIWHQVYSVRVSEQRHFPFLLYIHTKPGFFIKEGQSRQLQGFYLFRRKGTDCK